MEQARNAMDKLLADPRASELLDEETLAEIRRERPSYDTSPLSA